EASTRPDLFTEEDRAAYLTAWSQPGALTGGLNYYRAARLGPPSNASDGPPTPFVTNAKSLEVNVPTLVIWGEKDTALLLGNLEGLESYVHDLTLVRIPGGSHWVVHEESELICKHTRDFIDR
ncbi:MAG: alpha/beta hydrolase, partial [Acidobacteriota bacterium]